MNSGLSFRQLLRSRTEVEMLGHKVTFEICQLLV